MRSIIGFIRGIAALAVVILILVALSNFVPGFVGFVFGSVITLWVWPSALILLALLNKGWRVSGKVGITGWGLRSRFAFLRTLRDIDLVATFYDRMVYGDKKHNAKLNARQRLQLEHFDGYLDDEELKEELSALAAKNKARKTAQAKPEPRQPHQVIREEPVSDRTAPKANHLAQQPQTAPVKELHYEDVPVEDTEVREDETVEFETPAPAPEPQQRPAPRPAPRTSGSGVNNSSGFGGQIKITGNWAQPKN